MSLLGSELCEVYGKSFVDEMTKPRKAKKTKKPKKKYTQEDTLGDALLNDFSNEVDNLVEGFANFEKKPEPTVEIVQPEQFDEESDSESEPEERNYTVKSKKKSRVVKSKPKPVVREEKVQCEMDDMNDKINDLDVKLNLLLEKLNSQKETSVSEKTEEKNEMTNIYDLILFVIFGVFFLLLLESISKIVVKNATKLNNVNINPPVFNN
jgi:hypothetical protein